MSTIVTRLFDTYEHASTAVSELETGGIPHANISLVANNADDRYSNTVPGTAATTTTGTTDTAAGVSETDAHVYAEGVRRGGTLVTVKAEENQAAMVERVLDAHSPVDTASRGDAYRAEGWNGFDETAPAYTAGSSADLGMPGSTAGTTTGTTTTRGTTIL